ncbi:MerR family transcriptional regulator [Croceibacterium sp. LX-88]|uniref:MerR family transcriptional regulator n=1 Tax=Croceibacterium selenioxidans TaxID=2838833 RepID=A0ABS5W395_9SPHN|nr:MerR family transcriptional regulator [Croceibacterium selenioxidans]
MSDAGHPAFDDGKEPDALRTIGELAAGFGIRQHVLRYWEQQFPMLRPLKRSGGRRYYRPEDVALVATIDRLINREGYTLKGARQAIEKGTPAATVPLPISRGPASPADPALLPQLRSIRQRLAAALAT